MKRVLVGEKDEVWPFLSIGGCYTIDSLVYRVGG